MIGIKEFNKKIGSLKNTRKITKTMKMVSASKFKRAYKAQSNAQDYAQKLNALIARLAGSADENHPLIKVKKSTNKVLVILFTSDKGLCGGFNNNLIRFVKVWLQERGKNSQPDFSFCGRRGYMAFRKTVNTKHVYEDITVKPNLSDALKLSEDVTKSFLSNEYDEVYLAYNIFKGPLSQKPTIEKLLPLDPKFLADDVQVKNNTDYIYEPKQQDLFGFLLPKFVNFKLFYTLLENSAGEHGARMAAMDKATSNTADLIDRYTLLRNRARQAAITTELIEIISGAQALE